MDEAKYLLVNNSDSEEGEYRAHDAGASFKQQLPWWRRRRNSSGQTNVWKWMTALWTIISIILFGFLIWPWENALGTYEDGFKTDMHFEGRIPVVQHRTHGRLRLYPNFTSYIAEPDLEAEWPENLAYFGNPGPEEDKNWAVIMHDTHFAVTEDEARNAWGPDYQKYYLEEAGGWQAESNIPHLSSSFAGHYKLTSNRLAVFHALHCLNWVRKALAPDEYPHVARDRSARGDGHMSHCLEILRQHIQCYGSTTLIPSQHSEVLGRPYTDSDQLYTCRDFGYLRMWTDGKKNADRQRICSNGGESVWGTRCDGFPGPVDPSLWTNH